MGNVNELYLRNCMFKNTGIKIRLDRLRQDASKGSHGTKHVMVKKEKPASRVTISAEGKSLQTSRTAGFKQENEGRSS